MPFVTFHLLSGTPHTVWYTTNHTDIGCWNRYLIRMSTTLYELIQMAKAT